MITENVKKILEELNPDTQIESMLAMRVVSLSWRLKRIEKVQNQTFNALNIRHNVKSPFKQSLENMMSPTERKGSPKGLDAAKPPPSSFIFNILSYLS